MDDHQVLYHYAPGDYTGDGIPGVPLRDLTRSDLDALPEHVRVAVQQSPIYRAARAPSRSKTGPAEVKEKEIAADG